MQTLKVGCDIVHIPRFGRSAERGGEAFLDRIFTIRELDEAQTVESRAGLFAAKEAVIKALGLVAGEMRRAEITHNKEGRPLATIGQAPFSIASQGVSISHDGEYAFAVAVFLIEE